HSEPAQLSGHRLPERPGNRRLDTIRQQRSPFVKKLLILAVLAFASHATLAAKFPQPTAADQRIRHAVYSPSEVYELVGSYRITTTIEFEKGETVQYLTLGDSIAWQAHPMGHRVHLKPVEPKAVTNLTVVTDRRTYYFR